MEILKPYLKNNISSIIGAVITVVVLAVSSLWQPRLLQNIMKAIISDDTTAVKNYGVQLIVLAVIGIIAGIICTYFSAKIAQSVTTDLRADVYNKIQTFSFGNIEKFSSGSLVVRLINDMNQVLNLIMTVFMQLFRIPILFVGAFVLGIMTIPRLWWIEVLMIVCILALSGIVFSKMGRFFAKFQKWMDRLNTIAQESMQGIRVVKSFNQEENEITKFTTSSDSIQGLHLSIGYLFSLMIPAFTLISNLMILLAIYFVGIGVTDHPSDLAAIASFISYLMQLMFAIIIGAMTMMMSSRGLISLGRIKEVLETNPDVNYKKDVPKKDLDGSVEFKNVSFSYPNSKEPSLHNISFKVKSGETIGIVGATGSGKTSMAQLIPRLYDPTKGTVYVGDSNLREVDEASLRRTVSYVLQRAILFSGTIAENLRQGKRDASEEELRWAAEVSQAAEFIDRYEDGFEHKIEERSANLSGGQKQRLSIARGLIGKPKILILDDSTSALDAKSEKKVQEALERDLKGTTVFIIAEKIASVLQADKILVLDNGELVAAGKHKELLQTSPIYKEIYDAQVSIDNKKRGE
ncbi:multidrug ABC transporter permease ATP-binding protein [Liquorilactobacillus aquaticus DSM 21051]|uniref:Multidrug ABC transporter permease ATP-binding protein n=1 Tax=Liquorilactobacillus aquaticus DSM 21051 TaxID=1423725 RepID=A0A0R2CU49_9LACO|nr:ABC transporter ATP-binding protein [Liquorilactobacillus aquaticus]KRM95288.1 multidrug ABC transporter permease ATP-binding protein [Liquorilactobacillus aquaticus DSM 21051]